MGSSESTNEADWLQQVTADNSAVAFKNLIGWCKEFDRERYEELTAAENPNPNDKTAWMLVSTMVSKIHRKNTDVFKYRPNFSTLQIRALLTKLFFFLPSHFQNC